jgi:D-glycero-beta-D-manno-heptose-7-phosphate kinase
VHEFIEKFPDKKIVVVGDIVADQFLHGTIARVSREAPVFILRHDETETLPGGAANCAANVASLGGNAILIGLAGEDAPGDMVLSKLSESGVDCNFIYRSKVLKTTTKVRVLAGQQYAARQQVIRIDYENKDHPAEEIREGLMANLKSALKGADAIIISDYDYGAVSDEIFNIALKSGLPVLVDSRFALQNFKGATSATPNSDEVKEILGESFSEEDCIKLCEQLDFESLLITQGNKGMMLIEKGKNPCCFDAIGSKEPVDVTGAGDTVIAAFSLGLASGLNFKEAAEIANHAGGIVVMKKGTASLSAKELIDSLNR